MGSSRLPGKVLMRVDEKKTVLSFTLEQLRFCKNIDRVVIATTNLKEDNIIADFAEEIGVECFRGDSQNVLDRYYSCAKKFNFPVIVRITADCPLIDPQIVDTVIEEFKKKSVDYVTNCIERTFPYGTEVEVFSILALAESWKNAKLPSEKEHVTPYIKNHQEKFRVFNLRHKENFSRYRWVVDRENDLDLVRKIVMKIYERPILMKHIVSLFAKEPNLLHINEKNITDEGYLK